MVWFKIDDAFYSHPKVLSMPRAIRAQAIGTWTLAGAWSASQLTDGAIPAYMIDELGGTLEAAAALVKAGLWQRTGKGFRFKDWAEYQYTRAEVEAHREGERKRKAAYRAAKRGGPKPPPEDPQAVPEDAPERPAHVPEVSQRDTGGSPEHPYPSRPVPYPSHEETLLSDLRPDEPEVGTAVALIEPPAAAPAAKGSSYPAAFEFFWARYPRHEGKRKALAAWQAACKRADARAIADGAERYRLDPNREEQYTAHPTTWLNRDGWDDAPLPRRRPETQAERLEASASETLATLHAMGVA
jgi:hypothetical protein